MDRGEGTVLADLVFGRPLRVMPADSSRAVGQDAGDILVRRALGEQLGREGVPEPMRVGTRYLGDLKDCPHGPLCTLD